MLNAEATRPSVPNVVIGVTPSPSSVSEIPQATAKAEAAVQLELPTPASGTPSTPPVRDTLMAPAMAEAIEDEPSAGEEREPASEERVRVADKSEEPVEEKVEEKIEAKAEGPIAESDESDEKVEAQAETPPPNLHDTLIDAQKIEIVKPAAEPRLDRTVIEAKPPHVDPPAKSEAAPKPNFERTLPFGSAQDFEEEPKAQAKVEAWEEPPSDLPAAVAQDEETIPPAGDLAVAEQFFSEGDVSRHASVDDDLDAITNDKAQRKSDPDVVERRAKFAKVVTWAVGVSAALCLVAGAKMAFTTKTIASASAANAPVKTEVVVKAAPPPVAAPAVKAAEPAAVAAAPAEPAKPVVTGDVKEEKAKVKAALDKNKLADAIESGERAVAIDETDSEAWLLLGAAYHAKGELKEAQRAYHACLDKGTKDKFQRECRLFAR